MLYIKTLLTVRRNKAVAHIFSKTLLILSLCVLRGISTFAQDLHQAIFEPAFVQNKAGTWSVTTTIWPEPGAAPIIIRGLVAERTPIGPYCLHEVMQPAPGSGIDPFIRTSDLAFNKNESRWDYISIDTRVTVGIMYFTYLNSNRDSIVSFVADFPHPGSGPGLKNKGMAMHARSVIIQKDADHDAAKIYFRFPDQPDWLFMEYDFTRVKTAK